MKPKELDKRYTVNELLLDEVLRTTGLTSGGLDAQLSPHEVEELRRRGYGINLC